MNSFQRGSALIVVLLILLVIIGGGFYLFGENLGTGCSDTSLCYDPSLPPTNLENESSDDGRQEPATSTISKEISELKVTTPAITNWKMYINEKYNFTFEYPASWQLSESPGQDKVTIVTGMKTGGSKEEYPYDREVDTHTFSFQVKDNLSFEKVSSKVGNIEYSPTLRALIDTLDNPSRCLPLYPLSHSSSSVQAMAFSGSLMSEPAYHHAAILTNKEYMVIQSWQSYEGPDLIIREGMSGIYNSFRFTDDTRNFIPECSKSRI